MNKSQCQVRVGQRAPVFTGLVALDQVSDGVPQTSRRSEWDLAHTLHCDAFQKATLKSMKLIAKKGPQFPPPRLLCWLENRSDIQRPGKNAEDGP